MKTNFHTHTAWCDGKNTAEEMILGAVLRGFGALGFSSHAMLPGEPESWTLTAAKLPRYAAEIRTLAAKYADRIRIRLGVEADYIRGICSADRSVYAAVAPDYVIGSVHYVLAPDGARVAVDESPEVFVKAVKGHFGGDYGAFVRAYFAAEREMAATCDFDIVGHPDLCRKFNRVLGWLDESSPAYRGELEATADAIAASGKLVEVNTGAISRGWMDDAYPSADFRALLRARGVRFVLSSDAHSVDGLDTAFDRFASAEGYVLPAFA